MILDMADKHDIDCSRSYMVGDTMQDIAAGRAVGCRTVLIKKPYNDGVDADLYADSIGDIVWKIFRDEMDRRKRE